MDGIEQRCSLIQKGLQFVFECSPLIIRDLANSSSCSAGDLFYIVAIQIFEVATDLLLARPNLYCCRNTDIMSTQANMALWVLHMLLLR